MGTTRIKVIDLSSSQQEIKTSRKHAEKLAPSSKAKKTQEQKVANEIPEKQDEYQTQTDVETAVAPETPQPTEDAKTPQLSKSSKPAKPAKTKKPHHGTKYLNAKNLVEDKLYSTDDALALLPKTSYTKFDPSVELHLMVSEKNMRGSVTFPHAQKTQKKATRYLVFSDKKLPENKNMTSANEKTIEEIENAKIKPGRDFDSVIASPKFMPSLAKIAKILGPKGLMPNPKNGTVTEDLEKFLSQSESSQSYAFKTDPYSPVIHIKLGQLSQQPQDLKENIKALVLSIGLSKIKKASVTTTMGPAIKLDTATL